MKKLWKDAKGQLESSCTSTTSSQNLTSNFKSTDLIHPAIKSNLVKGLPPKPKSLDEIELFDDSI